MPSENVRLPLCFPQEQLREDSPPQIPQSRPPPLPKRAVEGRWLLVGRDHTEDRRCRRHSSFWIRQDCRIGPQEGGLHIASGNPWAERGYRLLMIMDDPQGFNCLDTGGLRRAPGQPIIRSRKQPVAAKRAVEDSVHVSTAAPPTSPPALWPAAHHFRCRDEQRSPTGTGDVSAPRRTKPNTTWKHVLADGALSTFRGAFQRPGRCQLTSSRYQPAIPVFLPEPWGTNRVASGYEMAGNGGYWSMPS